MEAVRWRLLRGVAHFLGREGLILKERGVRQRGGPPRRVVSETLSGEVEVVVLRRGGRRRQTRRLFIFNRKSVFFRRLHDQPLPVQMSPSQLFPSALRLLD